MIEGRYARQVPIPGLGEEGQRRLAGASVFVLGAGGLGFPVLTYLGAAGVGRVTFADRDRVDGSNLNRQCLFSEADVGRPKAGAALERLRGLNSEVAWVALDRELTTELADRHVAGCAAVLDCSDNHAARLLLAAAAHRAGVPMVHGAVAGFEAALAIFDSRTGPCFACAWPEPPVQDAPTPVLGAIPGVVGALMAAEVVRLVCGIGPSRAGRMLLADLERGSFDWITVERRPGCPVCSGG